MLFPEQERPDYDAILDKAINRLISALAGHQRYTRVLSTILSGTYADKFDDPNDWLAVYARQSATRIQPALLMMTDSDFQEWAQNSNPSEWNWHQYARHVFSSEEALEVANDFFNNLWQWGAPDTGVISGALMYVHEKVVLSVPPFSNME